MGHSVLTKKKSCGGNLAFADASAAADSGLAAWRGEWAAPYRWMIRIAACRAAVEVADLELDGSLDTMMIGGPWGDTGFQIPVYGIGLYDNEGAETLRNIHTHHHALDGLVIDGVVRGLLRDLATPPLGAGARICRPRGARQPCT